MGIERLKNLEITDEDIKWVEYLLGLEFDEERRIIIKNLNSVDIQAFPGSGKTTCLIAKLAILANKWPFSYKGICVLSHTNVAREEIEERLGTKEIGRRLLYYPHFIGTIHSFFDTFVALPWIRSQGIKINIIDTDFVRKKRYNQLDKETKEHLKKNNKKYDQCEYKNKVNNIKFNGKYSIKEKLLNCISESQKEGYYTFDEILHVAKDVLINNSSISKSIINRFPILFIDEAQDTNQLQWNLIKMAFPDSVNQQPVIQRYGDCNQEIYNDYENEYNVDVFPQSNKLVMSSSRRFDEGIANLANTVAVSNERMSGCKNDFSERDISHTIFLFSKENLSKVVEEFARMIIENFTDEEITKNKNYGCHVIGQVHHKKEVTKPEHLPKGIFDYWDSYDANLNSERGIQQNMVDYLRKSITEFNQSKAYEDLIFICLKGIRMMINYAAGHNLIDASCISIVDFTKNLTDDQKSSFRRLMQELIQIDNVSSEKWSEYVYIFESILSLYNLNLNDNVKSFLSWNESQNIDRRSNINNIYKYTDKDTGRTVDLKFGSIHSVKGRTHLATLVLETFSMKHNIKSILNNLCGEKVSKKNINKMDIDRLKCHYVAMTRATALLCLAIPEEFVDESKKQKLIDLGWRIKLIK